MADNVRVALEARPTKHGWDILCPEEPAGVPPPDQDIGIYGPRRRIIARVLGTDDAARRLVDAICSIPLMPKGDNP